MFCPNMVCFMFGLEEYNLALEVVEKNWYFLYASHINIFVKHVMLNTESHSLFHIKNFFLFLLQESLSGSGQYFLSRLASFFLYRFSEVLQHELTLMDKIISFKG